MLIMADNTIVRCTNPKCKGWFSVIVYTFGDDKCTIINSAKMVPMTGITPYYCPCCGKNLGKREKKLLEETK
jgi:hypothetical protein